MMKKAYESTIENRLKVFDNMLEGVAVHEIVYDSSNNAVDYVIIDVNPAYENITGFKREEVLGKKASAIYNVDIPPYIDIYSKVAITGEPEHFEAYFEPLNKYFRIVVTSPEKGKFAAIFEDISEYKTTEKKLKESEKHYRLISENMGDVVWILDIDSGRFNYVSPSVYQLRGYTAQEVLSQSMGEVLTPKSYQSIIKNMPSRINALKSGDESARVQTNEVDQIRKDGSIVPTEVVTTFLMNKKGEVNEVLGVTRDITKRKKAEKAIHKSEKKYRQIVETANEGIWVIDKNFNTTFANQKMAEMLGYTIEEMIGKSFDFFLFPEDIHDHNLKMESRKKGISERYERRFQNKNGSEVWAQVSGTPLTDKNNNFAGSFAMFTDITKRKKAEMQLKEAHDHLEEKVEERTKELEEAYKALSESEEKFRGIVNNANDMITLSEVKKNGAVGNFIEVNDVGTKLLGYSKEEFLNMTPYDIVHQDTDVSDAEIASEMSEKGYARHESSLMAKDGSKIPFEVATHFFKLKGRYVILAVSRDIRERKKAELALKESEEIYRRLLRESFDAWAIHSEGIILSINDSAAKIAGGSPEELIGKPILNFVHPDYKEAVKKRITKIYKEGGSEPLYEEKFLKLDGTPIDVEVMITALSYKGKPSIQIVFRDITERKNAEKQLKQTIQELKRSNKELRSFAYITSHDLQEPLRTMGNYAGLLKMRYKGKFDSDADDFLEYIASGAQRLKDMIQGLLDYSQVGTQEGEFIEFNSQEALDNALVNLHSSIEACHAEVTYHKLPTITANKDQISRVFQNFIGNALKFRKEGLQPKIHISAKKEEDEHVFSVSDNGIGLEEQYKDHIFEIFKRLHSIGEYQGTGIGLAIVKRIIEQHGGRIWVESEYSKGSTFYFTIPLNPVNHSKITGF